MATQDGRAWPSFAKILQEELCRFAVPCVAQLQLPRHGQLLQGLIALDWFQSGRSADVKVESWTYWGPRPPESQWQKVFDPAQGCGCWVPSSIAASPLMSVPLSGSTGKQLSRWWLTQMSSWQRWRPEPPIFTICKAHLGPRTKSWNRFGAGSPCAVPMRHTIHTRFLPMCTNPSSKLWPCALDCIVDHLGGMHSVFCDSWRPRQSLNFVSAVNQSDCEAILRLRPHGGSELCYGMPGIVGHWSSGYQFGHMMRILWRRGATLAELRLQCRAGRKQSRWRPGHVWCTRCRGWIWESLSTHVIPWRAPLCSGRGRWIQIICQQFLVA